MKADIGQRDLLITVAGLLEKHAIPYILTGSFAVSYYGIPRATHDIDFVIEVYSSVIPKLNKFLTEFDDSFLKDEITRDTTNFNIYHLDSGIKLDFWTVKDDDYNKEKFKRKRRIIINKRTINLISAEDLIINKLLWCEKVRSDKHLSDVAGIIKIQGQKLDLKYLNKKLSLLGLKTLYHLLPADFVRKLG